MGLYYAGQHIPHLSLNGVSDEGQGPYMSPIEMN